MKLQVGFLGGALLALSTQVQFGFGHWEAQLATGLETETQADVERRVSLEDAVLLPNSESERKTSGHREEEELVGDESVESLKYREAVERELKARARASRARSRGFKLLGSFMASAITTVLVSFFIAAFFDIGTKHQVTLPPAAYVVNVLMLICFASLISSLGTLLFEAVVHAMLGFQFARRKFAEKKYKKSKEDLAGGAAAPSTAEERN